MLPCAKLATPRGLSNRKGRIDLVHVAAQRRNPAPDLAGRARDRASGPEPGLTNLLIGRRDDLFAEGVEQPGESGIRVPTGHGALQSRRFRSSARRILLRTVS